MAKVIEITECHKYCFYKSKSKNNALLGSENINYFLKNLGWKNKKSAHQWRSVHTT